MRFATFSHGGRTGCGVVAGSSVYEVEGDLLTLVRSGREAALLTGAAALRTSPPLPLDEVRLLVPFTPPTLRDFVAFEEHVEGVRRSIDGAEGVVEAWYDAPAFYFSNPSALVDPGAEVRMPYACRALDFELEVAVVVGRDGRDLSPEAARDHVFGYTILNDWSARDLQRREMTVGLGPAKGKDFASTLGPWIVTADELDPYRDAEGFLDLGCTVEVNGVVIGSDVLSNMGWTFETMIAYAARDSRVLPGDVLGSGTVGHGGCLAELWGRNGEQTPPPLAVGDVVTLTVDGIGSLTNTVGRSEPTPTLPAVRRRDPAAARARLGENPT